MEYALINLTTSEIIDRKFFDDPPGDISHKGVKWLPLVITRPGCDLNFQVENDPVTTITEDEANIVYTVRNLTYDELIQKTRNDINQNLFGSGNYTGTALLVAVNQARESQNLPKISKTEFIELIVAECFPPEPEENLN